MSITRRPLPRLAMYGQRLAASARTLPPLVIDAIIATACVAYVVFQSGVDDRLDWWVPLLAAANAAPLMWRRRYPFAVTAITGPGTTLLALADVLGHLPAAQLVATYTFAALSPPLKRLIAVAGTIVGISVSILVPRDSALNLGMTGIAFAAAYALGTAARARRDRIAMLEERAQRLAEQQDAAAARERARIAREMHDILAHSMSLVVVQAEAGPVVVHTDPDKAEEVFDRISATAREALAQLRRALGVLRSDQNARAPQPGLDALPELVTAARQAGLTATLAEHGARPVVPADFAATVYRIVQESLTNTVKHADARHVRVALNWRDHALRLIVRDDGRSGHPTGTTHPAGSAQPSNGAGPSDRDHSVDHSVSGGQGLIGMRERVAAIGGQLSTGSARDAAGFQVSAYLPLPEDG